MKNLHRTLPTREEAQIVIGSPPVLTPTECHMCRPDCLQFEEIQVQELGFHQFSHEKKD